jgi:hypothetical protein
VNHYIYKIFKRLFTLVFVIFFGIASFNPTINITQSNITNNSHIPLNESHESERNEEREEKSESETTIIYKVSKYNKNLKYFYSFNIIKLNKKSKKPKYRPPNERPFNRLLVHSITLRAPPVAS